MGKIAQVEEEAPLQRNYQQITMKVMQGTEALGRNGVWDMALAQQQYPAWLNGLLTHPVGGLDNCAEMMRLLLEAKNVIKVYVEVSEG